MTASDWMKLMESFVEETKALDPKAKEDVIFMAAFSEESDTFMLGSTTNMDKLDAVLLIREIICID